MGTFDRCFTTYKKSVHCCEGLHELAVLDRCSKRRSKAADTVGPVLHVKAHGEAETSLHEFLTSALGGGD
jgi:hypothetical protein